MRHLSVSSLFSFSVFVAFASVLPVSAAAEAQPAHAIHAMQTESVSLSQEQAKALAEKIWQNEGAGKDQYLTHWNKGEHFASLGIGHFIWYVEGEINKPYKESFPALLQLAHERGVSLPIDLTANAACPWPTRDAFYADINSNKMANLRQWLKETKALQAELIAQRFDNALPLMLAAANAEDKDKVKTNYYRMRHSANGLYALIDYTNFKGEGTAPSERYQGKGWGLLQVLTEMPAKGDHPAADFVKAADFVLTRRVLLAPKEESRWLAGWRKRLGTYL